MGRSGSQAMGIRKKQLRRRVHLQRTKLCTASRAALPQSPRRLTPSACLRIDPRHASITQIPARFRRDPDFLISLSTGRQLDISSVVRTSVDRVLARFSGSTLSLPTALDFFRFRQEWARTMPILDCCFKDRARIQGSILICVVGYVTHLDHGSHNQLAHTLLTK